MTGELQEQKWIYLAFYLVNCCRFVSRLICYRYIDVNPQVHLVMMVQIPALPCHCTLRKVRELLREPRSPTPLRHVCFRTDYTDFPAGVWDRASSLPAWGFPIWKDGQLPSRRPFWCSRTAGAARNKVMLH